ncbi:MAG TPA: Na+/H+ antiporter NhaA [Stellaceae bacterium]|nr:Na+/H+ antiporter NhaA [Stellaceae bacterium]HYC14486.1 Na+/H+ antiporter NhaA [Stellaceae bacterium]
MPNLQQRIGSFLRSEAGGGVILMTATAAALIVANSVLEPLYLSFLDLHASMRVGTFEIDKPLLLWINDGLMALFFLVVGIEIKREVYEGGLSELRLAALPVLGAIGGMVAPALIFVAFDAGDAEAIRGWAIPCATDIAFALGILALAGPRLPPSLRVFLLALAIIDDLGAILIIAILYTSDLSLPALALAGFFLAVLLALNFAGVTRLSIYITAGFLLWVCVLKSGVHATLAGVAVGLAVPLRADASGESPSHRLEHILQPWVVFCILPVFAFGNAGVRFEGLSLASLLQPVPLGIACGLFFGKQIGVAGTVWVAIRLGFGALPQGANWVQFYGMAMLTGVGFTMSLFIGTLAFEAPAYEPLVRMGVLLGSGLSAIGGFTLLRAVSAHSRASS